MVQSSSSMPGLSDGCAFTDGLRTSTVASYWTGSGIDEVRVSHVRRTESMSNARVGKWCLSIVTIHCARSFKSLDEPATSGPRLSPTAEGPLTSHGRRKWRQRRHGTPSSHFSLRRRHSTYLGDEGQLDFDPACSTIILLGDVVRANSSLSFLHRQMALLCGSSIICIHTEMEDIVCPEFSQSW
jgi:hypothetical protein